MKFLGNFIRTGHFTKNGEDVSFTLYTLEFEGLPDELQEVWDFVCNLKQGDSFRFPQSSHPRTNLTVMEFSFSDRSTAAMVKLAFA